MLCIWLALTFSENYPKENVDNLNKIIHNKSYTPLVNKTNSFLISEINSTRILEHINKLVEEKKDTLDQQRKAKLEAEKGKAEEVVVSRSENYSVTYEATFYTAFCPTGCIGITASGYDVSNTIYYEGYRIVAMPPNIPFYTKLKITLEDGTSFKAIVLDRGGDIQAPYRMDILVASRDEAYQLGRQSVKVEVLN